MRGCVLSGSAVLALATPVACGSENTSSPSAPDAPPPADGPWPAHARGFTGTDDDGAAVVLAVDETGEVLVTWSEASCQQGNGETVRIVNLIDPFDASGTVVDGHIEAVAALVDQGLDGDRREYEVSVTGEDTGDGRLEGTLRVTQRYVNGQGEMFEDDYEPSVCTPVETSWTAQQSDDPTLGAAMWAFRDAALDDVAAAEAALTAGVDPGVHHPVRDTSLTQNVSAACVDDVTGSEIGWLVARGEQEVPFPGDGAEATEDALVELGVPPTAARTGWGDC